MIRKLRRLRVTVCFYACCCLCAILLFISYNEDVKSLIQQTNTIHRSGPSAPQTFAPSFASYSSSSLHRGVGNVWNPQLLISTIPPEIVSDGDASPAGRNNGQQIVNPKKGRRDQLAEIQRDNDVLKQYITDNFVGRKPQPQPIASAPGGAQLSTQQQQTTNVISNLVKLAQQASNNPSVFNNINSLTGDETNALAGDNEFSQMFMEAQGTTSDTELSYPGGDAGSHMRKRERHWFMSGGDYFPTPPGGLASIFYPSTSWLASKSPDMVDVNLWFDRNVGSDRVIDQLMFANDDPINYSNISWGFEGLTATTVKPSGVMDGGEGEGNGLNVDPSAPIVAHPHAISSSSQLLVPQSTIGRHGGMLAAGGISRDPRLGKIKTILLYYGLGMSWGSHVTNGRQVFLQQKCPINACRLTGNRAQLNKADLVVFKDVFMHPKIKRPPNQLWVMYMLECPLNTQNFLEKNAFNLTATYRHDSDIVTPYEKWVYFDETVRSLPQAINYAEGKTKKVAWFVSNCVAKNNRLEYARELAKYIEVDIYGACGSHTCSRANAKQCFEMLSRNYKFYLAFENSNCRDYVSEKFFVNGLGNNVLPIVMGAHPDDYKRVAPDRSYIHVDDFSSAKELAQYLHELDTNDDLYNEYFKWKGTGEFINTHFFCRLCAMAHYATRTPKKPSHYEDFNRWWRGPHVCTRQSWRSTPDVFAHENYDTLISKPN